jgi:Gpi18-like mannosyltransferase
MEPPSLARRLRAWPHWPLVAFVLGVKALLLVQGALSLRIPWSFDLAEPNGFFEVWNRWDALNYLHIAEHGYQATGDKQHLLAFYPLYPALIRALQPLCGSFLAAGFWISGAASVATAVLFHRLALIDHAEDATRAVFFMLVFPTSYALHIPYTESLFLTLACASLLLARSRRWALAGLLGACAALTRINGVALGAALLLEAWSEHRQDRRWRADWLFLLLVPAGALGYLLVNQFVAGDPFAFLRFQHEHFRRTLDWPWNGYVVMWRSFLGSFLGRAPGDVFVLRSQELLFATLMLAATAASIVRLRASYAAYMVVNTLLVMSFTYPWSVPRYVVILFPVYLLMARLGRRPLAFALLTVWSLLFLSFFSSLYVRGFWAF